MAMSELLHTLENEAQLFALAFMVLVYILRILWILRFRAVRERTFPAGRANTAGFLSLANVARPWAMESTRKNPGFYTQFVVFHVGIAAAIVATFIIPYVPHLFELQAVVNVFRFLIAASFLTGLVRLYRRISRSSLRLVSTPDDYFSLILLIFYLAVAFLAVPNDYRVKEWPLVMFFGLTVVLLIYVPFSKIGHYLYYPFARFILGQTMGHRGVAASKRSISSVSPQKG